MAFLLAACLLGRVVSADTFITESEREIPVAAHADVIVVGGTSGAVSAAVAAAKQGVRVFLAAPRPYLGEDVAGTLRLWVDKDAEYESQLERNLFFVPPRALKYAGRLPISYTLDQRPDPKHRENAQSNRLADNLWADAAKDSLQFNTDTTTIEVNLGGLKRVKEIHLLAFQRQDDFEVGSIRVETSPNGKVWRDLGTVKNPLSGQNASDRDVVALTMSVKQPCSFIKITAHKSDAAQRMLLGEVLVIDDQPDAKPPTAQPVAATPMQVKQALDQALIDAGVNFLYGCMVTDVLHDEQGRLAGIVMANRAGRQAVLGKVIVDGTLGGQTARIAGATFSTMSPGKHTFERIVVGGSPQSPTDGLRLTKPEIKFSNGTSLLDVYQYQMDIQLNDTRFTSLAQAEQQMRERTFDPALEDESDCLFSISPDQIQSRAPLNETSNGGSSFSLPACQPKQIERLWVLSSVADVPRSVARQWMQPLQYMRWGTRIGEAAAAACDQLPAHSGNITVAGQLANDSDSTVQVREFLQGPRPTDSGLPVVSSPERSLPVWGRYDCVVVGGGTGGAPAAIGAARQGAKTLLIEYQDHLGGVGTLGLISSYYHGYRKGFTAEVDQGVKAIGGPSRKGGWNPVTKREYWRREVQKAGCDIWFQSLGAGAVTGGTFVQGVVVVTPQGRGVVLAKVVIDSTGNCDIAAAAGAETITTSGDHVAMQGTGLSPRSLGVGYTNTDYSFSDESDPVDQWRMIVSARRKYKSSYDISPFIDSRERRRIVGEVFITPLDMLNNQTYHDTVSLHQSNFDTHGYTVHPVFLIDFPDKKEMVAPVPYRAMLPKEIDGIIVTGLGISAHRDAMPILRMQPCIQNQGYAAGVAGAMIARENSSTRSLNMAQLQRHLIEKGCLPENISQQQDSPPPDEGVIAKAVQSVVQDYEGLSLILDQPAAALPLLKKAYAEQTSTEKKLVYANILGMLGDDTGAATLIAAINDSDWDEGWNFRGMGQFGGSISRLDSHLIALGRSGNKAALDTILDKLASLDASKEFSHHRAVAMALESLADPRAAQAIAGLLAKKDMTGYAITQINTPEAASGNETRSQPLREIILARALYRCGDYQGVATKILQTYSQDLRGLFAKHAKAVLASD